MSKLNSNSFFNPKSRRHFLKLSGHLVAASALAGVAVPRCYAGENSTVKLALVGCGGRGTGAVADAFSATGGPVKLYAMADLFEQRLKNSLSNLKKGFQDKLDVPPERQFVGFDAYKKAIDCLGPGDVVLLTTHAAFRPLHFEYAVGKGINVFAEKSFATDAPAVRRWLRAAEASERKNLKVGVGFMWRHSEARQETIKRIHDGGARAGPLPTFTSERQRVGLPAPASKQFHLGLIGILHRLALSQRRCGLLDQGCLAGLGAGFWRAVLQAGGQPV